LRAGNDTVIFVYLQGDFDLIWERMQMRQNHYMKAEMLQSQFDTLEVPEKQEAFIVPATCSVEDMVDTIVADAV